MLYRTQLYCLVFMDELSKSFRNWTKCLTKLSKWRTLYLFKQMRNSLQVLHDWHIVVKSFFKSKTFKQHLNIYLDFAYVFCLFVSEGHKTIFHRQIDFDLMIVNKSSKKIGYKYILHRLIFILYWRTHTHICILSQWTKQRITSTIYLSSLKQ